jgi:hypothetical protein
MLREWTCPSCRESLGVVKRDTALSHRRGSMMPKLCITRRAVHLSQYRTHYVVRCVCGGYREWRGGRIEGPDKG